MLVPGETETAVAAEDVLLATLRQVWQTVSRTYDVVTAMPEPASLFDDAPLEDTRATAEMVLVNMLLEVMEGVDRFSPWYIQPASAFGLTTVLDEVTRRVYWGLSRKGMARWRSQVNDLSAVIKQHSGLIQAMILVDGLLTAVTDEDEIILAQCHCLPCRYIRVKKSILRKTEIICDICHRPFFPAEDYPGYDFNP